jgi:cephalosporin hydroxylase
MLHLMGKKDSFVIGVDIDIRKHNRQEIEKSRFFDRIKLIEGSSVDPSVVDQVSKLVGSKKCLLILDSNHTHDHVLKELNLYEGLVKQGSYIIVLDTFVEDLPEDVQSSDRPWGRGNNPKTAVFEFMKANPRFEISKKIEDKIQISVAYSGYLRCVKD